MIEKKLLKVILEKYNLSYEKIVNKNKRVIEYGREEEIEIIINYLHSIGIDNKNIESCPTLLYSTKNIIEANYIFLINNASFNKEKILKCLNILTVNNKYIAKNYEYITKVLGYEFIDNCPSVLLVSPSKVKDFCNFFKTKLSIEELKRFGGGLIINGDLNNIKEIIKEPYFKYDKKIKGINLRIRRLYLFKCKMFK